MKKTVDVVVTAVEINERHGVGAFLKRLFPDKDGVISIRSRSMYGGDSDFGEANLQLSSKWLTRKETKQALHMLLEGYEVRRILCVPYFWEDFSHALCLKELTGAPLCLYLMDDQNVFSDQVADEHVSELWHASDLRLAISSEMCAAYARKYEGSIHVLPPVLTHDSAPLSNYWDASSDDPSICAMVGNVWSASQFAQLRKAIKAARLRVEWYGSGSRAPWLGGNVADWERDGIFCLGHMPEEDLAVALAGYQCVITPSGRMDQGDEKLSFSRLSLPSRIVSIAGLALTPQLVLGHPETAAGRFVRNQGIGSCCDYSATALTKALAEMRDQTARRTHAENIKRTADQMRLPDAASWIWDSLQSGCPADAPFQQSPAFVADPPTWLSEIQPFRRSERTERDAFDARNPSTWSGIGYLRKSHLREFTANNCDNISDSTNPKDAIMSRLLARRLIPAHGRKILYLGTEAPKWQSDVPAEAELWAISNLEEWLSKGMSPSPRVQQLRPASKIPAPKQFDLIVAYGEFREIKDAQGADRIAQFIEKRLTRNGLSFSLFPCRITDGQFVAPFFYRHLLASGRAPDLMPLNKSIADDLDLLDDSSGVGGQQDYSKSTGNSSESVKMIYSTLMWRRAAGNRPKRLWRGGLALERALVRNCRSLVKLIREA